MDLDFNEFRDGKQRGFKNETEWMLEIKRQDKSIPGTSQYAGGFNFILDEP